VRSAERYPREIRFPFDLQIAQWAQDALKAVISRRGAIVGAASAFTALPFGAFGASAQQEAENGTPAKEGT
jgi:hypothetical protein